MGNSKVSCLIAASSARESSSSWISSFTYFPFCVVTQLYMTGEGFKVLSQDIFVTR
nr:MAG TPA: hypothetical protein [Caudoviricetes sp.]